MAVLVFLPIAYWMILFMGKQRRQCTREVWLEMKKFSAGNLLI